MCRIPVITSFPLHFILTLLFLVPQEHHTMMVFHDIGSIFLFAGGTFYFWAQTILTYNFVKAGYNTMCMFGVRLFLTILTSICGLTFFLAEIPAYKEFIRSGTKNSIQKWQPEDAGYTLHVISNVCEWVGASCFAILVSTFFKEFQKISLSVNCSLDGYNDLSGGKYSTFSRINGENDADSD